MAKFCPECGNPLINETSKFCDKCGANLPLTSPDVNSQEHQPVHSRWDVSPTSSDPTTVQTRTKQTPSPITENAIKKRSVLEWIAIVSGGLILLVILSAFVVGMVFGVPTDNYKYCTDHFPGTAYDPSSKMCEKIITQTSAQQTNIKSENDRLFASKTQKHLTKLQLDATQISNAARSYDTGSLSFWSSQMSSDSSDAINELSSIQVSPEFQSIKDEFLSALYDFKKAGDSSVTGVNYLNKGQTSLANSYLENAVTYMDSGSAKMKITTQLIESYNEKYGS